MKLMSLSVVGFRSYQQLQEFGMSPAVTVIVGENARGKTNILEAIYLLATGESFRASKIEEMVHWEAEVGHVVGKTEDDRLQVTVTRGVVQGKRVQKRLYKVNGVGRRKQDIIGLLPVVLFRPEDMNLVSGEPSLKRGFLDEVLIQVDREYRWSLASYQKGLRQRNRLLDQVREGRSTQAALYFWDQLLIKEAAVIHEKRNRLVETINQVVSGRKQLCLRYTPSTVSPEKFAAHLLAELALGYTLSGPHKDDLRVLDGSRDLAIYGSRGEQRMAVLWLKTAQLGIMAQRGDMPVLLLDDILSELDHHHVAEVVELCRGQQTVVTTTDEGLSDYFGNQTSILRLDG